MYLLCNNYAKIYLSYDLKSYKTTYVFLNTNN